MVGGLQQPDQGACAEEEDIRAVEEGTRSPQLRPKVQDMVLPSCSSMDTPSETHGPFVGTLGSDGATVIALEGDSTPGTWQQGLGTGCTLGQGVSGLVTKGES